MVAVAAKVPQSSDFQIPSQTFLCTCVRFSLIFQIDQFSLLPILTTLSNLLFKLHTVHGRPCHALLVFEVGFFNYFIPSWFKQSLHYEVKRKTIALFFLTLVSLIA